MFTNRANTNVEPIAIETLDRMTAILGAELRLTLVPGIDWAHNRLKRVVTYPRQELLEMSNVEATGKLWRTVQHALSSWGEFDAYDLAVDTMLAAEKAAGVRAVHARWILDVIKEVEKERVEHIARKAARNLINNALPLRGTGYRAPERAALREALATPDTDGQQYWHRVALACGGLCAGSLTAEELPVDMPWNGLIDDIKSLIEAPTYDDMLLGIERLIPEMSKRWITHLTQPEEPQQQEPQSGNGSDNAPPMQGDSEAENSSSTGSSGDEDTSASDDGDDETDASNNGAPSDPPESEDEESEESDEPTEDEEPGESEAEAETEDEPEGETPSKGEDEKNTSEEPAPGENLSDEVRDRIEQSVENESNERAGIDFFDGEVHNEDEMTNREEANPGWGNGPIMEHEDQPGPAWNAVSRSNARVRAPIQRVFQRYLVENEIGEMETGRKSGRLNTRVAMRPVMARTTPPFKRRLTSDERSYDIAYIIDHSGSMCSGAEGPAQQEAFGPGPLHRWHIAARMAVALTEAVESVAGVTTTLVSYEDHVKLVKRFDETLTPAVKQRVMDNVRPEGGNEDARAIHFTADQLKRAPGNTKIIFHLTDGQFCSSTADMNDAVKRLKRDGIEYVVLTLGLAPDFARRYVPHECAEQITDDNVGQVLAKHLRRVLNAA